MDYYLKEIEGKTFHDGSRFRRTNNRVWVPEPVIIGAGPSGLAASACLKQRGVSNLVLERANCIASLWQNKTYDRLRLHLPKQFCELPFMPFPTDFPTYPNRKQFVAYLEAYVDRFDIRTNFNRTVLNVEFDATLRGWRIKMRCSKSGQEAELVTKWVIVATGENADPFVPKIEGLSEFKGTVLHTSEYKNGDTFDGKKVLVVGCGNSGMEVCLDLCDYNARTALVVRDSVHVLPHEMFGKSTFGLSMWLLKFLPIRMVDQILLSMSHLLLGNTAKYGLVRPKVGPLELKSVSGKTPVLDVGIVAKIRTGDIKVYSGIKRLRQDTVEFSDGKIEKFDAIILATGYKSNVPTWLKECDMFSEEGFPRMPFPNGWKGKCGLYAVGFTRRGLLGVAADARRIAEDIDEQWKGETKSCMTFHYKLH